MIAYRAVPPSGLRAIWPWVRVGLDKVGEKCRDDWWSEDIWASLRVGTSTLYVYDEDGEDVGFAVMQKQAGIDGPVLFVWACWFEPRRYLKRLGGWLEILDETARSIGAREVRHHSSRMGWIGAGFEQHTVVWRRVVAEKDETWVRDQAERAALRR